MRVRLLLLLSALCLAFLFGASAAVQADTNLDTVLRFLGISANPGHQKGLGDYYEIPADCRWPLPGDKVVLKEVLAPAGDIWVADLEGGTREPLTNKGGYRWPVFEPGGKAVLALAGNCLVRIPIMKGAKAQKLYPVPGVKKLVGFDRSNPDRLLVTRDQPESPLAVLAVGSGRLTVLPLPYADNAEEQCRMLARIQGETRDYAGARLYTRGINGANKCTDVYIQGSSAPAQNVSRCGGSYCGQPSLSPDGKAVVYIQSHRQP